MFDAVPVQHAKAPPRPRPWTAEELGLLRAEYRAYSRRRALARLAARLGRSRVAVHGKAQALGLCRPRAEAAAVARRVATLRAAGVPNPEIARRVRRSLSAVRHVVNRLIRRGVLRPRPVTFKAADHADRIRRAARARLQKAGCDDWGAYRREAGLRRYAALGYPPGVHNRITAAAVDLARERGGVTAADLAARLGLSRHTRGWLHRPLRDLAACGALEECPRAARAWPARQWVTVYRLTPRAAAGA